MCVLCANLWHTHGTIGEIAKVHVSGLLAALASLEFRTRANRAALEHSTAAAAAESQLRVSVVGLGTLQQFATHTPFIQAT